MYDEYADSTATEVVTTASNGDIYEEVRLIHESLNDISSEIEILGDVSLLIFVSILLIFIFKFLFSNLMSWFGD